MKSPILATLLLAWTAVLPVSAQGPEVSEQRPAATKKAAVAKAPQPTLTNVPYGKHERQVLDFWKADSRQPTPLVFVIHGGGWTGGEKERVSRFVNVAELLKAGISVVAINYRLIKHAEEDGVTPLVKAPSHDAALALQFVRSKAAKWNIDKQRIGAAGGSAGACSSLWLAFHDDLADAKSADPVARESTRLWCAAVTGAQTTLDPQQMKEWTPNSKYGGHAFGLADFSKFLAGRDQILPWIAEYSPYALVTPDDPPVFLSYSTPPALGQNQKDPTHTSNFGVKLQEQCAAKGVACELAYPGASGVKHPTPTAYLIAKLKMPANREIAPPSNTISVAVKKPNILFIISDDQAWADYGFMGHPHIATPALDKLAARGLTFTRGYTPVPLCRPSLSSIVTGLYPHQHGVTGNDPDLPDKRVNVMSARGNPKYTRYYSAIISNFNRCPNLVRDLTGRGYLALQTGKWWEGNPVKTAGFTHAMTVGTGQGDRHGGVGLGIGRDGIEPIRKFIREAGDRPWLVWYAPMLPHSPHRPPDDLLQKYLKIAPNEPTARYWACIEWFDRTCRDVLDYLDQQSQATNTIVVYTTDNGWLQNPDKVDRFAARSKNSPYEGGVRTPILISWPGHLSPAKDTEHLACNLDLWPTLAALLEIPTPDGLPGINLADSQAVKKRERIYGEQYAHNIADVDDPARSLQARWMVDGWWKLIVPDSRNQPESKPELYDLRSDPWEMSNLIEKESARAAKLGGKLDAWWKPKL